MSFQRLRPRSMNVSMFVAFASLFVLESKALRQRARATCMHFTDETPYAGTS